MACQAPILRIMTGLVYTLQLIGSNEKDRVSGSLVIGIGDGLSASTSVPTPNGASLLHWS